MNQNERSPRGKVNYSETAERGFAELDALVAEVESEVKASRGWRLLEDPGNSNDLRSILREILQAVHMYQRHTPEAGFRMIGRLPKSEVRLMQVPSHRKPEEAEHGLWAWADYLAMGGNPDLHEAPPTPAAFAVAAVWDRMADRCNPFGYIGAEYLLENLTERLTKAIAETPDARVAFAKGTRFLSDHVTEDVRHANLFRHLIKQVLTERPDAIGPMTQCLSLFRQVYPIPQWDEALVHMHIVAANRNGGGDSSRSRHRHGNDPTGPHGILRTVVAHDLGSGPARLPAASTVARSHDGAVPARQGRLLDKADLPRPESGEPERLFGSSADIANLTTKPHF